jgi:hypothetical protein
MAFPKEIPKLDALLANGSEKDGVLEMLLVDPKEKRILKLMVFPIREYRADKTPLPNVMFVRVGVQLTQSPRSTLGIATVPVKVGLAVGALVFSASPRSPIESVPSRIIGMI